MHSGCRGHRCSGSATFAVRRQLFLPVTAVTPETPGEFDSLEYRQIQIADLLEQLRGRPTRQGIPATLAQPAGDQAGFVPQQCPTPGPTRTSSPCATGARHSPGIYAYAPISVPLLQVPHGAVNVHGHVHEQESPTRNRHVNVSVEQLNYRPAKLSDIRRLARRLVEGHSVPGHSTRARLNVVERVMP